MPKTKPHLHYFSGADGDWFLQDLMVWSITIIIITVIFGQINAVK